MSSRMHMRELLNPVYRHVDILLMKLYKDFSPEHSGSKRHFLESLSLISSLITHAENTSCQLVNIMNMLNSNRDASHYS